MAIMLKKTRRSVTVWLCQCERCGHKWESQKTEPPTSCAKCTARNFNKPARPYRKRATKPKR